MNSNLENITQNKNLRLLFLLRNVAIVGQLLSVSVAYWGFSLKLAVEPMLVVIGLLALVNVFTAYRLKQGANRLELGRQEVFIQLLIDVLALSVLIYFSGGISNPFIGFFILQVVIAAILLEPIYTWLIVAITGCAYLILSYVSYDVAGLTHSMASMPSVSSIAGHAGHAGHVGHQVNDSSFNLHLHGMFLGYVIVAVLVAFFVVRMANNLRERDQEIYRIQQQAYSETEIMKLGMLAAGAAHELGTPLNAIQLATDELKASLDGNDEVQPTLNLLARQVSRCCQSVNDLMTVVRQPRAMNASEVEINQFLLSLSENWNHLNPTKQLECHLDATQGLKVVADKLLSQSIINLLDNAARVSDEAIQLISRIDQNTIEIIVQDSGPGMPEEVQRKLKNHMPITDGQGKVRLGLFLVNTLVQRIGGALSFDKSSSGKSQVILSIPVVDNSMNGEG
ncbi:ATP-binding protein [Litoribrevibacter albus]|nr:ATP-binding protein [Litoribrevibacter albus]